MHRFFITPAQIRGAAVWFDDEQAHQMRRVLRLRPGARVVALDGAGWQYEVVLEEVGNSRAAGRVAARTPATGEPRVRLTLCQSLLQRDKFEWVLQKGTEIGVAAFVPVITRRSLVREGDVGENKLERWRRIIKEAAEQSGRGALPSLSEPRPLAAALSGLSSPPAQDGSGSLPLRGRVRERGLVEPATRALIAWEGERQRTVRDALGDGGGVTNVALFIGPEGGYEAEEIDEAASQGAVPISLGRRILRTETAAVVGAALVLYELGEMGAAGE
jgi:16S rRNA (uracil1498-N3)-methyltransferase